MDPHLQYFQQALNDAIERRRLRLEYRHIRDYEDPFQLHENEFGKIFRLNRRAAFDLIQELNEFRVEGRKNKIPAVFEVLACLSFCASGGYQRTVGGNIKLGMSQPSISRTVNRMVEIISVHLLPRYVKFPTTSQEIAATKKKYQEKFNFPQVIGCIDCTHISIIKPKANGILPPLSFYNIKEYYSINVQIICDANLRITNINGRCPGSTHNSAVWETSTIKSYMQKQYVDNGNDSFLLGDSGYPLEPWLLTPYPNVNPNTPEERYNKGLALARNTIEQCIGILKQRFRCLRRERKLHYNPTFAAKVAYTCAVLHNICITQNIPVEESFDIEENNLVPVVSPEGNADFLEEGRLVRQRITEILHNF